MDTKEIFQIRTTNEEQNDFIITVGQHLATEEHFKSREEAIAYIDTPKWEMIIAIMAEMLTIHEEVKHKTDEIKNDAKKVVNTIIEDTKKQ